MPTEAKIERRKVFTVAHAQLNSYGDLMVTDTENNEYKIGNKRAQLHELFQTDAVVEVGYTSYLNKEYIAVAHPFEGVVPTQEPAPPAAKPEPKGVTKYKVDPTKIASIEKQVSLKCANELAVVGKIEPTQTLSYAEVFYRWLTGRITVKDEEVFESLIDKHFIEKGEGQ